MQCLSACSSAPDMTNSRMIRHLVTHPHDLMNFQATGRLPDSTRPASPLITLLKALAPRDLARLVGVTVDARLGYTGSRQFHYGPQALTWAAPSSEVFGSFPAESWQDKRFVGPLYLETLAECCYEFPEEFFDRYRALCRPAKKA